MYRRLRLLAHTEVDESGETPQFCDNIWHLGSVNFDRDNKKLNQFFLHLSSQTKGFVIGVVGERIFVCVSRTCSKIMVKARIMLW